MKLCVQPGCNRPAVVEITELSWGGMLRACELHTNLWASQWLLKQAQAELADMANPVEHTDGIGADGTGADSGAHHRM